MTATEVRRALAALESVCVALERCQRVKPCLEIERALESLKSTVDWLEEYIAVLTFEKEAV